MRTAVNGQWCTASNDQFQCRPRLPSFLLSPLSTIAAVICWWASRLPLLLQALHLLGQPLNDSGKFSCWVDRRYGDRLLAQLQSILNPAWAAVGMYDSISSIAATASSMVSGRFCLTLKSTCCCNSRWR